MTEYVKNQLRMWARQYHCRAFIADDPIQFPHRHTRKADIEISGLLTALLSFGARPQILKKADALDNLMQGHPHRYVLSGRWQEDFPAERHDSYYRMVSYATVRAWFERLYTVYSRHDSLEDALATLPGTPMERLCAFMNVSAANPQKKLNMFLRWMIRTESEVDFGIWSSFRPSELIIPLDTHVCHMACELGLISRPTFSLGNARRITAALAEVFPGDPCLGDFALFGYGINRKGNDKIIAIEEKSI